MTDATLSHYETADEVLPMKAPLATDPVWNTALDWLERVQLHPDDIALREACEAWQAADPSHAKAWRKAERVWRLSATMPAQFAEQWQTAPAVTPPVALAVSNPLPKKPGVSRRVWIGSAIAASLVLALLPSLPQWRTDYASGVGEIRQVLLSDGTRVTLGSDSALNDRFDGNLRNVELLRGEAYFDVTPDASRPFTVSAGSGSVRVTGTAFDVRLGAGQLDVAVAHGSVKVSDTRLHSPALTAALIAGERVHLDYTTAELNRDRLQPTQIASWRQKQLIADDKSIGELVNELRRYHHGVILMRDENLAAAKVTGVYDLRDPQAALKALVQAHGGQVQTLTPYLWVVSRP